MEWITYDFGVSIAEILLAAFCASSLFFSIWMAWMLRSNRDAIDATKAKFNDLVFDLQLAEANLDPCPTCGSRSIEIRAANE